MVGDDSFELPFKVITLEQQRSNVITGWRCGTNESVLPFVRL
jgi:hypothetical protein